MSESALDGMYGFLDMKRANGIREMEKSLFKVMEARSYCDLNLEDVVGKGDDAGEVHIQLTCQRPYKSF